MSGETEEQVSGWTVDTLHSHVVQQFRDLRLQLDERFRSQQEMVAAALSAAEKAVDKQDNASEKRFESVNEFRAQLSDQQQTFLTRQEYNAAHQALVEKIDDLSARMDRQTGGSASTYRMIGWGFALITVVMSIVVFAANYIFGN